MIAKLTGDPGEGRAEMAGGSEKTFAELLEHLFQEIHPPGRGSYTNAEVAEAITKAAANGGKGISASAIAQLRNGQKRNPMMSTIKALADFFGVEPGYFFDQAAKERTEAEIALVAAMRDQDVRRVALRAKGLSGNSLSMVTALIEQARSLEGLTDSESAHGLDLSQ
ncbi:helix-turn-helix domain-containing protein [Streptomyces sp. NPDC049555]|uniref:helix-turn-helix domain-containing protein n=1 Tax=Streptomyces sp. NPDC049555 TaxID=3154930 RepID=UPI00341FD2E9